MNDLGSNANQSTQDPPAQPPAGADGVGEGAAATGADAASLGSGIPAPPRPRKIVYSEDELVRRVADLYGYVFERNDRHHVSASWWSVTDTWTRVALALAASLSAVSLLAENATVTAIFAITTAVGSALNAALDPAQRAAKHRAAARDFRRLIWRVDQLSSSVQGTEKQYVSHTEIDSQGVPYDAHYYAFPSSELQSFSEELAGCEANLEQIEDSAPPVNHLVRIDPNGTPRTKWGLRRLRKYYARQQEAAQIRADGEVDWYSRPWSQSGET